MAIAVVCIVVIELCWSVGLNTLVSTMKSWLQDQGFSNADSSSVHQIFTLLSFALSFLGGIVAECYIGRYMTILIFSAVYVAGCALTAVAANPGTESIPLFIIGILVLTAPGTGGVKPNIGTFGADQFDPAIEESVRRKEAFFMYLYVCRSVGSVIAFGFLANVATAGLPPYIPKEYGFFCAYIIMASLMAIALLVFTVGTPFYRKESFEKNTKPVLMPAVRRLLGGHRQTLGKVALLGWLLLPTLIILSVLQVFHPSLSLTIVSLLVDLVCIGCLCVAHHDNSWLGEPDSITRCLDVVPKIIVGNVTFNVVYNTMFSLFYSQACQMDTRFGGRQLSGAFFNLGDAFPVIILTPLLERFIVPAAEKLLRREVTSNMKVLTGISVAIASQLTAAGLEYSRRSANVLPIPSNCAPLGPDGHVRMSAMSAFWMVLPYALVGIGEVLVNPVLWHVAYTADPAMKSLMQAFCQFAMGGLPNAISAALTQATKSWTPNNLNDGNLPMVYFVNVVFCIAGCAVYVLVARNSCSKGKEWLSSEDSGEETSDSEMQ